MSASVSADNAWTRALIAATTENDIEPLVTCLGQWAVRAWLAGDRAQEKQLQELVGVVRILHAKTQRRGHANRSSWQRWRDPNYVAAWVAEQRIAAWKREQGKKTISATTQETIIKEAVALISGWNFASGNPADADRVRELLRGSRANRL